MRGGDVGEDDTVGGSLGLHLGGRSVRLDTHVLVLHVVERGSGVTTHALPEVFPALSGYVGPVGSAHHPSRSRRQQSRPGWGRPRSARLILAGDQVRATRAARAASVPTGSASASATCCGTLGDGIHPRQTSGHRLAAADERLARDGDGRDAERLGRLGDPDDDLAAQRLPVEAALPRDDEVGRGQHVAEADGVEHRPDTGDLAGSEQVQGVAETARGAGAGLGARGWAAVPESRSLAGGRTRATMLAKWPRAFSRRWASSSEAPFCGPKTALAPLRPSSGESTSLAMTRSMPRRRSQRRVEARRGRPP